MKCIKKSIYIETQKYENTHLTCPSSNSIYSKCLDNKNKRKKYGIEILAFMR